MECLIRVGLSALLFCGVEIACGQAAAVSNGGVPVVTVCEALQDLSRYNGMVVIVVGRSGGTNEGSWLSEDCERKIVTEGYTWANIISTAYGRSEVKPPPILPADFRWDEALLATKLKEIQQITQLRIQKNHRYDDRWVAIFGRFEARLLLQVLVAGTGTLMGYGFGHGNQAPAQLISNFGEDYYELKPKKKQVRTSR